MADTKISALPADAAVAGAEEIPTNDAGTNKKVTASQIKTFANTAPAFAAGSATAASWPTLASGTKLTAAEAGAMEYDGDAWYMTPNASNRGAVCTQHIVCLNAAFTLINGVSAQKMFNGSTNGTLTLPTGTYFFECLFSLSNMSPTSGNAQFLILGGGSATLSNVLYMAVGIDGNPNAAAAVSGALSNASTSPVPLFTVSTNTNMQALIKGTFRLTGAGSIIPSIALTNAFAAVVAAGSYFRCYKVGTSSFTTVGNWS